MYENFYGMMGSGFWPTAMMGAGLFWLVVLMVWDSVWKAIGLWKSGTQRQLVWFICIFIFNTAGILPIVYLLWFQKKGNSSGSRKRR